MLFVLFYLAIVCPCVSGKKYSQFPQEFCVTGLSRLNAWRRLQSAATPFFPASALPVYRGSDRDGAIAPSEKRSHFLSKIGVTYWLIVPTELRFCWESWQLIWGHNYKMMKIWFRHFVPLRMILYWNSQFPYLNILKGFLMYIVVFTRTLPELYTGALSQYT